jgi:hypothetical protein
MQLPAAAARQPSLQAQSQTQPSGPTQANAATTNNNTTQPQQCHQPHRLVPLPPLPRAAPPGPRASLLALVPSKSSLAQSQQLNRQLATALDAMLPELQRVVQHCEQLQAYAARTASVASTLLGAHAGALHALVAESAPPPPAPQASKRT